MADTFEDLQLKAIDDACNDRIKNLFGNLVTCLMPGAKSPDADKVGIQHFAMGLEAVRQARETAIKLVSADNPVAAHDGLAGVA